MAPRFAFEGEGTDGGFDAADGRAKPLVIFYAQDLEAMPAKVKAAGGTVTREILSLPRGRRFHFQDPSGHELGVWSAT